MAIPYASFRDYSALHPGSSLTENAVTKADANGDLVDSIITDNGTTATVAGYIAANRLNVDNIRIDGNSITSQDTDGNITLDPNGTGIVDVVGSLSADQLDVDNIQIDGNTVSSTNADGNITLDPNGSGIVSVASDTTISANLTANQVNADNLRMDGSTLSSQNTNGYVIVEPNGTGIVLIKSDMEVEGALTLGNIQIDGNTVSSTNTNGNIVIEPDGTGDVILPAQSLVTDTTANANDDDGALQVSGGARVGGALQVDSALYANSQLRMTNSTAIEFRNNADSSYLNCMFLNTSDTLILGFSAAAISLRQDTTVNSGAYLRPTDASGQDLGASDKRWDMYASLINLDGGHLSIDTESVRGTESTSIADDAAQTFTPAEEIGVVLVTVTDGAAAFEGQSGLIAYGAQASGQASSLGLSTDIELAAHGTALAGTTGNDDKVTISIQTDGTIDVENRSGAAIKVRILYMNQAST